MFRSRERVAINLLIDILRGMRNQAVLQGGYDQIKTYGAGADLPYLDWYSYIHQMLNDGLFYIAYEEGYALKITERGHEVLKGQLALPLKKFQPAEKAEKPTRAGKKAANAAASAAFGTPEAQLFDKLRKLRKQIADEQGVPPYVVFSDATLQEMAAERPVNRVGMLGISGVGMKKFETYGEAFIRLILEDGGGAVPSDSDNMFSEPRAPHLRRRMADKPVSDSEDATIQFHQMGLTPRGHFRAPRPGPEHRENAPLQRLRQGPRAAHPRLRSAMPSWPKSSPPAPSSAASPPCATSSTTCARSTTTSSCAWPRCTTSACAGRIGRGAQSC